MRYALDLFRSSQSVQGCFIRTDLYGVCPLVDLTLRGRDLWAVVETQDGNKELLVHGWSHILEGLDDKPPPRSYPFAKYRRF